MQIRKILKPAIILSIALSATFSFPTFADENRWSTSQGSESTGSSSTTWTWTDGVSSSGAFYDERALSWFEYTYEKGKVGEAYIPYLSGSQYTHINQPSIDERCSKESTKFYALGMVYFNKAGSTTTSLEQAARNTMFASYPLGGQQLGINTPANPNKYKYITENISKAGFESYAYSEVVTIPNDGSSSRAGWSRYAYGSKVMAKGHMVSYENAKKAYKEVYGGDIYDDKVTAFCAWDKKDLRGAVTGSTSIIVSKGGETMTPSSGKISVRSSSAVTFSVSANYYGESDNKNYFGGNPTKKVGGVEYSPEDPPTFRGQAFLKKGSSVIYEDTSINKTVNEKVPVSRSGEQTVRLNSGESATICSELAYDPLHQLSGTTESWPGSTEWDTKCVTLEVIDHRGIVASRTKGAIRQGGAYVGDEYISGIDKTTSGSISGLNYGSNANIVFEWNHAIGLTGMYLNGVRKDTPTGSFSVLYSPTPDALAYNLNATRAGGGKITFNSGYYGNLETGSINWNANKMVDKRGTSVPASETIKQILPGEAITRTKEIHHKQFADDEGAQSGADLSSSVSLTATAKNAVCSLNGAEMGVSTENSNYGRIGISIDNHDFEYAGDGASVDNLTKWARVTRGGTGQPVSDKNAQFVFDACFGRQIRYDYEDKDKTSGQRDDFFGVSAMFNNNNSLNDISEVGSSRITLNNRIFGKSLNGTYNTTPVAHNNTGTAAQKKNLNDVNIYASEFNGPSTDSKVKIRLDNDYELGKVHETTNSNNYPRSRTDFALSNYIGNSIKTTLTVNNDDFTETHDIDLNIPYNYILTPRIDEVNTDTIGQVTYQVGYSSVSRENRGSTYASPTKTSSFAFIPFFMKKSVSCIATVGSEKFTNGCKGEDEKDKTIFISGGNKSLSYYVGSDNSGAFNKIDSSSDEAMINSLKDSLFSQIAVKNADDVATLADFGEAVYQSPNSNIQLWNHKLTGTTSNVNKIPLSATSGVSNTVKIPAGWQNVGVKMCLAYGVYPADSHNSISSLSDDTAIYESDAQLEALKGDVPGNGGYWRFTISCGTSTKTPNVSVEGNNLQSGGFVKVKDKVVNDKVFGSWTEYGISSVFSSMSSGASLAYNFANTLVDGGRSIKWGTEATAPYLHGMNSASSTGLSSNKINLKQPQTRGNLPESALVSTANDKHYNVSNDGSSAVVENQAVAKRISNLRSNYITRYRDLVPKDSHDESVVVANDRDSAYYPAFMKDDGGGNPENRKYMDKSSTMRISTSKSRLSNWRDIIIEYMKHPDSRTLVLDIRDHKGQPGDFVVDADLFIGEGGLPEEAKYKQILIFAKNIYVAGNKGSEGINVTKLRASFIANETFDTCYFENPSKNLSYNIGYDKDAKDKISSDDCNSPLVIDGFVIADQVALDRTYGGDLLDEDQMAAVTTDKPAGGVVDAMGRDGYSLRAEIFNYTPETVIWAYNDVVEKGTLENITIQETSPRN